MGDSNEIDLTGDGELLTSLRRLAANLGELGEITSVAVVLLDSRSGDLTTCVEWEAPHGGSRTDPRQRVAPEDAIEGNVATRLEPVILQDARSHALVTVAPDAHPGSLVCLPLIEADRLLGTLTATAAKPHAFDAHHQHLTRVFADQAALTIGRTVQAETARAQAEALAGLLNASRALTGSLEPDQVLAQIVASIRAVLGCDDALVYALEPANEMLRLVASLGPRSHALGKAQVALSDPRSLAARAAREGRPHLIGSTASELGDVTEVFVGGDRLSLLAAPLISKDVVRGVVVLARAQPFRPTALAEMASLGNLIAATLENVSLYQSARAGQEQLAAIFAAASDAIALVDTDLHIVEANDAFATLTRFPAARLHGQRFVDAIQERALPGNTLCDEQGPLSRVIVSGAAQAHIESLFALPPDDVRQDRTRAMGTGAPAPVRALDFSITPIPGPEGYRALLVGRDMTAQREVEQLRSSFLSMVSHELRGPLQAVNGYLDLVLSGQSGALSPQQRQYITRSRAGGQRLATIVDDLLLLSRRDAGQFSLRPEPIDVVPLAGEVAEEMEVLAKEAGVRLELALPPSLPQALADAPRVAQVLRNLLSNAIKFTPRGGTVTVEAAAGSDRLAIRVRDTGIGIPTEHQARIFERFYQVLDSAGVDDGGQGDSRDGRRHAAGQGLGLAIVRIIIEGHGGAVQVQSERGKGSAFTFTLPLA